ncbi:MAG: branched-chain amino acid ABC transporter permease [Candidatus Hodarchaeales archaeon]|jgi:branched-chain amino acid transport system permease protein
MKNQSNTTSFEFLHEERWLIVGLVIFFLSCILFMFFRDGPSTALELILSCIVLGTLYSILSLGFSLILGVAKQFKLSLGGYYVLAAYAMFFLLKTVKIDPSLSVADEIDQFLLLALILLPIVLSVIILVFLRNAFEKREFLLVLISPIISVVSVLFLGIIFESTNQFPNLVESFYIGLTVLTVCLAAWFLELPKKKVAIGTFILGLVPPLMVLFAIIAGPLIEKIPQVGSLLKSLIDISPVYLALMLLAVIFTSCVAMIIDRYVIEKARVSIVTVLIITFAVALFLQSLVQLIYFPQRGKFVLFSGEFRSLPSIISQTLSLKLALPLDISVTIQYIRLVSMIFCIIAVILLYIFIWYTKMGRALRAVAQDEEAAALTGINIRKISAVVSGIGMALVAFAAILTSPFAARPQWSPFMGWTVLIMAIAIVTLGGMGSLPGTILGAFIFSFTEILVTTTLDPVTFIPGIFQIPALSGFSVLIPFFIVFLVMIVKPEGLLGIEEEHE